MSATGASVVQSCPIFGTGPSRGEILAIAKPGATVFVQCRCRLTGWSLISAQIRPNVWIEGWVGPGCVT